VQVHTRVSDTSEEPGGVLQVQFQLTVADMGRGMTAEEAAACFEAYRHVSSSAGGGTGLGLYISLAFAALMGGSLTVESVKGEGTTFSLTCPVELPTGAELDDHRAATSSLMGESAAAETSPPLPPSSPRGTTKTAAITTTTQLPAAATRLHVLVADDHVLNLNLVARLLRINGFLVTAVKDGQEALDELIESFDESGSRFHAAVLDMSMPVLSGPEAAAAFQSWERSSGEHQATSQMPAALTPPIQAILRAGARCRSSR